MISRRGLACSAHLLCYFLWSEGRYVSLSRPMPPSGAGLRMGVSAHAWPPSRMTEKPSLTGSCGTWCLAPRAHSLFSRRPDRPAVDASTPYWTDRRDLSRSLRLPAPRASQSPVKVAPPCVWKTLLVKCDVDQGQDDAPSQGQVR